MTIGFIGAGGMAQAIIRGLITTKTVAPADILVTSKRPESYQTLATTLQVTPVSNNQDLAAQADQVVLAVTPNVAKTVLREIRDALNQGSHTLISIVAGLSLDTMEELAGYDLPILRTLPNVNVEVGAGMTAVAANDNLRGPALTTAVGLFNAIGSTTPLPEAQFGVFSALAGSSPAFIDLFIDAMSRAGVKHGLSKAVATQIAAQAVLGSAQTLLTTHKSPFEVIDAVSSPGGSTVAGLLAMEADGLMTAVVNGIDATIARDAGD